jgi:hypothetical protein
MNALPAESLTAEQRIAMDFEAAERLADAIVERHHDDVRGRITISPQTHHRASSFGYPCDRRLYHDIKDWQTKAPVDPQVQQYFDRGNDQEGIIERILSRLGFRIISSQVALYDEELRIGARSDGNIVEHESGRVLVAELKSTDNAKLLACRTVDDLRQDKWGKRYHIQVTLYMRATGIGAAVLILWDASNWRPVVIPIPYDPILSEQLADRARRLNDHLDRNDPPGYINDSRECRHCPHFARACSPPMSFGVGAQILTDEELLAELERHTEIEAIGKEFNRLDAAIKGRLKGDKANPQDGLFIIGPYEIHRSVGDRKGYTVQATKTIKVEWEKVA